MVATVTIPVVLGGTGITYRSDTGAYGMASSNGYGYAGTTNYFMAMLGEGMTALATVYNASTSGVYAPALWVTGTTYAQGVVVYSPSNWQNYRKKTASSVSNTDPASDSTNWEQLTLNSTSTLTCGGVTSTGNGTFGTVSTGRNVRVYSSSYGNNGLYESYGTDSGLKFQAGAIGNSAAMLYAHTSCAMDLYAGGVNTVTLVSGAASKASANAAATALMCGKDAGTSRSINAGGTVNASGADYAEYMRKSAGCGDFEKGAIVGVNAQGLLTDKWAEAIHWAIKSTDPSYVGGDVWGTAEALGLASPQEPVFDPTQHQDLSEEDLAVAAADFMAAEQPKYEAAAAAFRAAHEAARQQVDRIAFAGQVPVNVYGASPGQYVVPVQVGDGIGGAPMAEADMTLAHYMRALGKVIAVAPDGRARLIVKVA